MVTFRFRLRDLHTWMLGLQVAAVDRMSFGIPSLSLKAVGLVAFCLLLLIYCNLPLVESEARIDAEREFLLTCSQFGYNRNSFAGPILTSSMEHKNWFIYEWRDTTPGSDFKIECIVDRWGPEATISGKEPRERKLSGVTR